MTDYIVCTRTRYVPIFVYTISLLNTVIYMFPYLYYNLELTIYERVCLQYLCSLTFPLKCVYTCNIQMLDEIKKLHYVVL